MNENAPGYTQPPPPPPPPQAPAVPPSAYAMGTAPPIIVERKSAFLAGLLSFFVPGLGHLYLGAYQRALYIFGGLVLAIVLTSSGAWPFGFAIAFAWFFGIVDSVRLTRAINMGTAAENQLAWEEQVRKATRGTASLTWGVILVGLGSLYMIDRYVDIDWSFMHEWGFPLAMILLGFVLIATHVAKKRRENESGVGLPPRSS